MGLNRSIIKLMARIMKDEQLSGNCITFGVQGIDGQYDDVENILIEENYNYTIVNKSDIIYDDLTQYGNTIHQSVFFKMLGFSQVDSIDYFPRENPTFVANLNEPVSAELFAKYDMLYDGGTAYYCINTIGVLSNVIRLLKVGGRVIHYGALFGYINCGYYQFSPMLFFDFYGANGFEEMKAIIILSKGKKVYWLNYEPSLKYQLNELKSFNKAGILFSARKQSENKNIVLPVYADFMQKFSEQEKSIANNDFVESEYNIKQMMKKLLRKNLLIYRLSTILYIKLKIMRAIKRLI